MAWNYRVFKKEINGRTHYCLKETYYDTTGEVVSFTEDTIDGYYEDLEHLQKAHENMLNDITRYSDKVLCEEDFNFE